MDEQRIRFTVRYDGTGFAGSQLQPGFRTVAGTLKNELESLLGTSVHLMFAGRTDAGVHADGNVCAFDGRPQFPAEKLPVILNPQLPEDIVIREAKRVHPGFHPRFDAISRSYVYRFYRQADIPVDRRRYCAQYLGAWDEAAVREALALLPGRQAFSAFSKGCNNPADSFCTLQEVRTTEAHGECQWWFVANRFLRHLIVRLMGALFAVAAGSITPDQIRRALSDQEPLKFKPAEAKGLTLVSVEYPTKDVDDE
ncbi:tRNA pseudouridine(38-40) synthase TruA [bacterium]|nr:tRNA pseudouridine(38-40) synthase TruA [bacterium]